MLGSSVKSNRIFNTGYVTNFNKFVCDQFEQFMKEVITNTQVNSKDKISLLDDKLTLVDEYKSRYAGTIQFLSKRIEDLKTQLEPGKDDSSELDDSLSDTEIKRLVYLIRTYTYKIKVLRACIIILNGVRDKLTVIRRVLCFGKQDHKRTHKLLYASLYVPIAFFFGLQGFVVLKSLSFHMPPTSRFDIELSMFFSIFCLLIISFTIFSALTK